MNAHDFPSPEAEGRFAWIELVLPVSAEPVSRVSVELHHGLAPEPIARDKRSL